MTIKKYKFKIKRFINKIKYYYYTNNKRAFEKVIKRWYLQFCNCELNLKNPETFNEKIQWLKVYDCISLKTYLSDKYLVRDWVKNKIGEKFLIPIHGAWDNFSDININKLPNQFVLKTNHGSGWNIIIKDKKTFNYNEAKRKFDFWLKEDFSFYCGYEFQYHNIHPKILVEEYIEEIDGNLNDYKIHCFNGEPKFIQVIGERKPEKHEAYESFYDTKWNLTEYNYTYNQFPREIPKPEVLDELLELARKLCKDFIYVRVDFYILENNVIKFGEMTFTPASGIDQWRPKGTDIIMGNLLKLPIFK